VDGSDGESHRKNRSLRWFPDWRSEPRNDLSIDRVEFSGLNVDSALDGLSVDCVKISGLKVDSALDGLSVDCVKISGLNVDAKLDGLSIAHESSKRGTVVA
jgi:hypothetical protein